MGSTGTEARCSTLSKLPAREANSDIAGRRANARETRKYAVARELEPFSIFRFPLTYSK